MQLLTLLASPRPEGNTAKILGWVETALADAGHTTDRIDLSKLEIGGCRSCFACEQSKDAPGCVLQDDAQGVFERMIAADAILFATPLYMWSYAAQLKTLLDRTLCLARGYTTAEHRSFVQGKPAALLVSCGGGIDGSADAIQQIYPRVADYMRLDDRGPWVFANCTTPEDLPAELKTKAQDLAAALVG